MADELTESQIRHLGAFDAAARWPSVTPTRCGVMLPLVQKMLRSPDFFKAVTEALANPDPSTWKLKEGLAAALAVGVLNPPPAVTHNKYPTSGEFLARIHTENPTAYAELQIARHVISTRTPSRSVAAIREAFDISDDTQIDDPDVQDALLEALPDDVKDRLAAAMEEWAELRSSVHSVSPGDIGYKALELRATEIRAASAADTKTVAAEQSL